MAKIFELAFPWKVTPDTPEDIYARGQATLEQCLLHGVTYMRTQIEVDPNVGLRGFEAVEQLRKEYAWAIDIQPCVFLQEGMGRKIWAYASR